MTVPRAVRNHNPGNLRRTDERWQGEMPPEQMTPEQTAEKVFVVFEDDAHGFRALAITLRNYQKLHGLNTLQEILERFAPINENDTEAYVKHVSGLTGFAKFSPLNLSNPSTMRALCKGIAIHEAGGWFYNYLDVMSGVGMAGQNGAQNIA